MRFLHISDVHLGNLQYNNGERFNDFGRAFENACLFAINQKVQAVLISGDLFDAAAVEPKAFLQAATQLTLLQKSGILVIAVSGNHDSGRFRDGLSWLEALAELGYLVLLQPGYSEDNGITFSPYDDHAGGYIDLNGVRIYGLSYLGGSTRAVLDQLPNVFAAEQIDGISSRVLLAHFGLEGFIPHASGGVPSIALDPLKSQVDYLALGHWHKPFVYQNWAFNPGSSECCDMDERNYRGGYYLVDIDSSSPPKVKARHVSAPQRLFYRLVFMVDPYISFQQLGEGLEYILKGQADLAPLNDLPPVVELCLEGRLGFDRVLLDLEALKLQVTTRFSPLLVRLQDHTDLPNFSVSGSDRLTRAEVEHQALLEKINRDPRYQNQAEGLTSLMEDIKDMALNNSSGDAIFTAVAARMQTMQVKES